MPPVLRAGDADRDACVEKLEAAYAEGRITDHEREHRVARALAAVDLADLATLTQDLEVQATPAARRRAVLQRAGRRNAVGILAAVVGLPIVLVITGIVFVVASVTGASTSTSTSPSVAVADPAALQLHTAEGFGRFVQLTRDRFGSTRVVDAAVYPDYASVQVPVAGSATRVERWYFKDRFADEPSLTSRAPEGPDIDLARIDPATLAAQIARTPAATNVPDATTVYLVIDRDADGAPYYSIYASNEFSETGWWRFDLDGQPLLSRPFGS